MNPSPTVLRVVPFQFILHFRTRGGLWSHEPIYCGDPFSPIKASASASRDFLLDLYEDGAVHVEEAYLHECIEVEYPDGTITEESGNRLKVIVQ